MSRWLLAAILMVSASGVLFGLDWRPMPEPHYQPAAHVAVVNHSLPPSPVATAAASRPIVAAAPVTAPVTTAKPPAPTTIVAGAQPIPAAAEFKPAPPPALPSPPAVVAEAPPPADAPAPPAAAVTDATAPSADIAAAEPAPKCDVRACEAAYFTFRAADCTYQPANGARRFCSKGNPPQAALPDDPRKAQASACNVQACRQAYFSFNAADCTYQPSNGPRRVCAK